ncbi:hypothetical protein SteCoe_5844 [Stentor coeruleus]|uniref:Thioredoxin domain-containing protein n=1 Tax=Stentor coeruleus TaxID=5963 RepID=A0A1R2CRF2_9CILI|nr:hypothetical protein SteCoe_5844 [Stentor coeruleus]
MPRILLILLSYLSLSSGLFTSPNEIQHILSKDLSPILENPDYMIMTIIHDEFSTGSIILSKVLEDLVPKYTNYIVFLAISCEREENLCNNNIMNSLPAFQAYIPGGINPYTSKPLIHERPYQGKITLKDISNFFNENIPYLGDFINVSSNEEFLAQEGNKVLLFTNKDKVPLIFRGLSSKYRDRFEFGVVWQNQTLLIRDYGIKKFPMLIVVEGDDVIEFEGNNDFDEISRFLDKYKANERRPQKAKKFFTYKTEVGDDNKFNQFPIVDLNAGNYGKYVLNNSGLYLVHFFKDKASPEWEDIKKDYNGIVKLANFNCKAEEEFEVCQEIGVKKYPSIRVFPMNSKRKSFELIFDSRKNLEDELSRELHYDITFIQENTVQKFINAVNEEFKVGIILIADGNPNLQFKALSSEDNFKEFVKFGNFKKPRETSLSVFSIKNYPSIIAFAKTENTEDMKFIEYTGKFDDYRSLYYFIDQEAIPIFLNNHKNKILEEDQEHIEIITTSTSFSLKCLKKPGLCLIGMFPGEITNKTFQSKAYKTLKNIKDSMEIRKLPVNFVILDGICQYELREYFGISEISLPNLGVFITNKKKGARLIGTLNFDDITSFVDGILREKLEIFDMSNISFKDGDCEDLNNIIENNEDEDILMEILSISDKEKNKSSDTKRANNKKGLKKNSDL